MSQAVAAQVVPPGQCTVIVASRVNMAEVQDFMFANSHLSFDAVYEAENGWLAVSIGLLPVDSAPGELAGMKSRGLIPLDSYCSNGRRYLGVVWSPAASSNDPPPAQPEQQPHGSAQTDTSSSGTGFFIDADGHVMTNYHVIAGCNTITVGAREATLVSQSESFDLAILKVADQETQPAFLRFSDEPARLNSDITVAGFPLHSVLGGLNVTRGSISAMEGLLGDTATMQITAPVQPGNSGGPIVDQAGNVVGIVVSKLDAGFMQEVMGDIPQKVNFGIRGPIGKMFAEMNGVGVSAASAQDPLTPVELAEKLALATVLIQYN
jgi:S1-C subfamily serine protease